MGAAGGAMAAALAKRAVPREEGPVSGCASGGGGGLATGKTGVANCEVQSSGLCWPARKEMRSVEAGDAVAAGGAGGGVGCAGEYPPSEVKEMSGGGCVGAALAGRLRSEDREPEEAGAAPEGAKPAPDGPRGAGMD